jgi:Zn finger protein HypA/HybF involved in hydrogenase expression
MVRFQCIHCGGRIAVQKRHMNRLARCPECGSLTHPLAEHLSGEGQKLAAKAGSPVKPEVEKKSTAKSRGKSKPASKVAASSEPVTGNESSVPTLVRCDNCGEPLGKLQRPIAWNEHRVCGPCHRALSIEKQGSSTESTAIVSRLSPGAEIIDASSNRQYPPAGVGPEIANLRKQIHVSDFTLAFWGACLGLCATALAIYAIITVLQSLSVLIVWVLIAVGLAAGWFWVKRGVTALRTPHPSKKIDAIVRVKE